jgi:hypothetical protein
MKKGENVSVSGDGILTEIENNLKLFPVWILKEVMPMRV